MTFLQKTTQELHLDYSVSAFGFPPRRRALPNAFENLDTMPVMATQPDELNRGCEPHTSSQPADLSANLLCNIASLLNALQCGALLINRCGRIAHVNSRLCEMMQMPCAQLVGHSLFELYPTGHGRSIVQHALENFDESREQEFFIPRSDGTQLPVMISGRRLQGESPMDDHRIVTVIGIEQQKAAEQELQQRYHDIATLSDTVLQQAVQLKRYSQTLEQRILERTRELHTANMEAIYMLAIASEAKDHDTGAHVRRIEHATRLLALELGLAPEAADRIAYSAILHDVGKIHIPDEILRKPGALSADEWAVMRQHTLVGERILSREPFFETARSIARSHHENWDGSGYPDQLRGADIPLAARIVRVADVYDALTSTRPYKHAWKPADAATEIEQLANRSFDPDVVRVFSRLFHEQRFINPNTVSNAALS